MFTSRIFVSSTVLGLCLAPLLSAQTTDRTFMPQSETQSTDTCTEVPIQDSLPFLCVPPSTVLQSPPTEIKPSARIPLLLNAGTALRISLSRRTRISHASEIVQGTIVEPVYAFDQVVIPGDSQVAGRIVTVDSVSGLHRAMAYANGNFSPFHKYEVEFDTVILPNGQRIPVKTFVSPGTAEMVHLVSSPEKEKKKNISERATDSAKQQAKNKITDAKEEAHQSWEAVRTPGRLDRLKHFVLAQSPYRRQYLEIGTRFNADVQDPIAFGEIERTAGDLDAIGTFLPLDSTVKARLVSEVNSATATRGDRVDALLTEPLYSSAHKVILPANTLIVGEVVQSRPARKFHRNGELRLIFRRVEIPMEAQNATQEILQTNQSSAEHTRITGNLEGLEVDRQSRMTLDEEGGAHTTDSKTRYLSTGLAVLLAAAASHTDTEHGTVDSAGDPGIRIAAGGSGFRLVGAVISLAAKSSPVSIAFSAYGASSSIYANFLSRGREIVFPKDTPLEIGFGNPRPTSPTSAPSNH